MPPQARRIVVGQLASRSLQRPLELTRGAVPHRAALFFQDDGPEIRSVAGGDPAGLPTVGFAEDDRVGSGRPPFHRHLTAAALGSR